MAEKKRLKEGGTGTEGGSDLENTHFMVYVRDLGFGRLQGDTGGRGPGLG